MCGRMFKITLIILSNTWNKTLAIILSVSVINKTKNQWKS